VRTAIDGEKKSAPAAGETTETQRHQFFSPACGGPTEAPRQQEFLPACGGPTETPRHKNFVPTAGGHTETPRTEKPKFAARLRRAYRDTERTTAQKFAARLRRAHRETENRDTKIRRPPAAGLPRQRDTESQAYPRHRDRDRPETRPPAAGPRHQPAQDSRDPKPRQKIQHQEHFISFHTSNQHCITTSILHPYTYSYPAPAFATPHKPALK